ncbi:DUF1294 domain-containing protein [Texcoconibacillus texcoconensis]|uniref:Uncharacterized membrane protein YsdA (DUF1294 family) n=1 Tax=Texcoconibacillus texcoconensis TaxID=1095777 RepID=A0A840QMW4_9BACI|nr:DUF1294 domain-containing protein [Texcoconibacillus texcoconensis]MBB5172698.1 uncharacterized membrane protein YsdA (DUF1294 family) [Texcoconibacillus texcoconensis]
MSVAAYGGILFVVIWSFLNLFSLYIMMKDKKRSQKNQWRVKEKTLWYCALLGGSIGVYIGMKIFRHKSQKPIFRYGIPLLIVVQMSAFITILITFSRF